MFHNKSYTAKVLKEMLRCFVGKYYHMQVCLISLAQDHLFASIEHSIAKQCFTWYENKENWLVEWFAHSNCFLAWRSSIAKEMAIRWIKCHFLYKNSHLHIGYMLFTRLSVGYIGPNTFGDSTLWKIHIEVINRPLELQKNKTP